MTIAEESSSHGNYEPAAFKDPLEQAKTSAFVGATATLHAISELTGNPIFTESAAAEEVYKKLFVPEPIEETQAPQIYETLTKREIEILELATEGHSNMQLGKMLWVTEQTVKFHLSNIYRKIDKPNRTAAAQWWRLNRDGYGEVKSEEQHLAIKDSDDRKYNMQLAAAFFTAAGELIKKALGNSELPTNPAQDRYEKPPLELVKDNSASPMESEVKLADKALAMIEENLGIPLDIAARDEIAAKIYEHRKTEPGKQLRYRLQLLIKTPSAQKRLDNLGISLRSVNAREYFQDLDRHPREVIWIFERDTVIHDEPIAPET
ncbi:helix-turn-helix transcriptional regulator [Candidatus Saccharibacteria bacterium]|nr:helix-turn-helix transcriptional regulator [Candidatus Saccharibacteria bacterium]